MASTQTTILAEGSTAATSSDVALNAGIIATIGIFSSTSLAVPALMSVYIDSPGADVKIGELTRANPVISVCGPGTFRVVRAAGSSCGAWSET